TDAILGYYIYGTRSSLNSTLTGTTRENTSLDTHILATRLTHYEAWHDVPVAAQLIIPAGSYTNGKINGFALNEPTGLIDPIITLAFWPISQPEAKRWLAVASYTSFPVGSYSPGKALNTGGNRFQNDLQIGFTQGIGNVTLALGGDWIWYGDNEQAGTGRQRL